MWCGCYRLPGTDVRFVAFSYLQIGSYVVLVRMRNSYYKQLACDELSASKYYKYSRKKVDLYVPFR